MAAAAPAAAAASPATDSKNTGASPSPEGHVDIRGIDKQQLLKAMWISTKAAGFFGGGYMQPTYKDASQSDLGRHIEYYCGRPIKANLSGDSVYPRGYDRDAPKGSGALQSIVDSLRSAGGVAPEAKAPKPTCWGCHSTISGECFVVKRRAMCHSCHTMFGPMFAAKD